MKKITYLAVLSAMVLSMACCKKPKNNTINGSQFQTGYNASTENVSTIPTSLNTTLFAGATSSLPSSVDLTPYFPPVGDQGQYGTCIAWSSGYNMKTALEAINKGYSTAQLTNAAYQMSPKDLYLAIADNNKASDLCEGTNFDAALTVEQTRGVATLQTVPYTNMGTCSQQQLDPSWATDAANHTITSFRKVTGNSNSDYISAIKQNLYNKTPVVVGFGVGNGFQNWRGSGVMTTGFDPCGGGGECGGHAQCIIGYDDSKGSGGAFRIVNSWGATTWGDNGYYWVDYNFMLNTMVQKDQNQLPCIFVATNGTTNNPTVPTVNPSSSGVDLATWVQEDFPTSSSSPTRQCNFNIYNIGSSTASASSNWDLYYVYYNAYNADDYGVIFHDQITTSVASGAPTCNGNVCAANFDIAGGDNLANALFGEDSTWQDYLMPSITGDYYLVLVADAGQVLNDANYDNNFFYTSDLPAYFVNGYFKNGNGSVPHFKNEIAVNRDLLRKNQFNTAVNKKRPNAYTSQEISKFLKAKKASGDLEAKARAHDAASGGYNVGLHGK